MRWCLVAILGLACGGDPAEARWTASAAGDCAALGSSAAAVPCWTAAALESAEDNDEEGVLAACRRVSRPLWRDECHFQAAERLGREGALLSAARLCAQAGRFADYCGVHLAWWARPFPLELGPQDPGASAAVAQALGELAGLQTSDSTRQMLQASVWFDLYYGAGHTDAGPARRADSALARTAWAHEVVRLGGDGRAWTAPLEGAPLAPRCWRGQVVDPAPAPDGATQVPLVHGGLRLVGSDAEEDRDIAILEARYFHALPDLDPVRAALLDPRTRVRWTAGRVLARSLGPRDPLVVELLAGEPGLAAEVRGALRQGTVAWEADPLCGVEED